MIYKKISPISIHGYTHIHDLKKVFPEIKDVSPEELSNRFSKLGVKFYQSKTEKVPYLVRFTMPLALITILLMFIGLPINFLFTGEWGYSLGKPPYRIYNWLKSLKLS